MEQKDTVTMVKGDQTAEVTPDDSVKIMEEQGWKLAEAKAPATFTAKHKGGGKFEVLDPEGKVVAEGLSKADAEAKAAELNKPAA